MTPTGMFRCPSNTCPPCTRAALDIQRTAHPKAWASRIAEIAAQRQRECVSGYLRAVYQRWKAKR